MNPMKYVGSAKVAVWECPIDKEEEAEGVECSWVLGDDSMCSAKVKLFMGASFFFEDEPERSSFVRDKLQKGSVQ